MFHSPLALLNDVCNFDPTFLHARRGSVVSADGSLEADNQMTHSEVDGQPI